MNCIHSECGLCPDCKADCEEDFEAWLTYGDHVNGIRRWNELLEDIRKHHESAPPATTPHDAPF